MKKKISLPVKVKHVYQFHHPAICLFRYVKEHPKHTTNLLKFQPLPLFYIFGEGRGAYYLVGVHLINHVSHVYVYLVFVVSDVHNEPTHPEVGHSFLFVGSECLVHHDGGIVLECLDVERVG